MNFKKISMICALFLSGSLSVKASSARANEGYSVIIAPSNIITMNIAFDLYDQKPSVLISYEADGNSSDPFLHIWNKTRWVPLDFETYQAGSFVKRRPNQVIVLGKENALTENLLNGSQSWGPQSFLVPVDNARTVINGLGQRFNFTVHEWRWFAERYDLDLVEVNAAERSEVWYDQPNYFKDEEGHVTPPPRPGLFRAPPKSAMPPPSAGGDGVDELDGNPAVIKSTPEATESSDAVSVPDATPGRIQTLESIEKVRAPEAEEKSASDESVSAKPPLESKDMVSEEGKPEAIDGEAPNK